METQEMVKNKKRQSEKYQCFRHLLINLYFLFSNSLSVNLNLLCSAAGGNRKDKSLRIMSQKFVMLFLVSKTQTVTLDAAAKVLIEESQDSSSHSKYKSKKEPQRVALFWSKIGIQPKMFHFLYPFSQGAASV